jgi:hypothetical protein
MDERTSFWRVEDFQNLGIGAQTYMGPVEGTASLADSMKNSDYGAMRMLARVTADPVLMRNGLPSPVIFKLPRCRRQTASFQDAVLGQYYLPSSEHFAEEWGDYVEPIARTYYALIVLGSILLSSLQDAELKAVVHTIALLLVWPASRTATSNRCAIIS